jgi:hypothetical protein
MTLKVRVWFLVLFRHFNFSPMRKYSYRAVTDMAHDGGGFYTVRFLLAGSGSGFELIVFQ